MTARNLANGDMFNFVKIRVCVVYLGKIIWALEELGFVSLEGFTGATLECGELERVAPLPVNPDSQEALGMWNIGIGASSNPRIDHVRAYKQ